MNAVISAVIFHIAYFSSGGCLDWYYVQISTENVFLLKSVVFYPYP